MAAQSDAMFAVNAFRLNARIWRDALCARARSARPPINWNRSAAPTKALYIITDLRRINMLTDPQKHPDSSLSFHECPAVLCVWCDAFIESSDWVWSQMRSSGAYRQRTVMSSVLQFHHIYTRALMFDVTDADDQCSNNDNETSEQIYRRTWTLLRRGSLSRCASINNL